MQDFLTLTFEAVALFGIAYTILSFGAFVMGKRRCISPGQMELPLFPDVDLPDLDNLSPLSEIEAIDDSTCPTCYHPTPLENIGPDGQQCQTCWESECARGWWEAIAVEPVDDLLSIPASPAPVRLVEPSIRQLKALASLYEIPRFNRLTKGQLLPKVMEAIA